MKEIAKLRQVKTALEKEKLDSIAWRHSNFVTASKVSAFYTDRCF